MTFSRDQQKTPSSQNTGEGLRDFILLSFSKHTSHLGAAAASALKSQSFLFTQISHDQQPLVPFLYFCCYNFSFFLPEEAIRWLKGISSIMGGLRFIQLPRLKPTRSSEIKARSCKTQETLRYKLCPRTLYWKKNDWERHTDDFMRKWQPSLQRKIMNLINLAFRRDLLYNPGTGTITQNTWE